MKGGWPEPIRIVMLLPLIEAASAIDPNVIAAAAVKPSIPAVFNIVFNLFPPKLSKVKRP